LLNIGVIINPPLAAVCLMDYKGSDGKNRKGKVINQTPHARGISFNVGGGANGPQDEYAILSQAVKDKVSGLGSVMLERNNNACHCDCYAVK
jgi:hypothetical protein